LDAGSPITGTGGTRTVTTGTGGAIDVPTGGAFNRGTGGAGNATGIFDCTSSTPIPDLSSAQMGDACVSGSSCCVTEQYANNASLGRACVNDHMMVVNVLDLDSIDHAVDWKPDPSASWSNCADALANGHSSDTCTWNGGACSRPTSDPCCIDITECYDFGGGPIVERKRLCAPGCSNVTPDLSQPVMTACPTSSNFYGPCNFAAPCRGDFVCDSVQRLPITDPKVTFLNGTLWCANGVLAGGAYPTNLE
jgi:hypothetical protein